MSGRISACAVQVAETSPPTREHQPVAPFFTTPQEVEDCLKALEPLTPENVLQQLECEVRVLVFLSSVLQLGPGGLAVQRPVVCATHPRTLPPHPQLLHL